MAVFVAFLLLTAVLVFFSFPAGFYSVYLGRLSTTFNSGSLSIPYLWVGPLTLFLPFNVSVGESFFFFSAVYFIFVIYSLRQKQSPVTSIANAFRHGAGWLFRSPFLVTLISIGFLVFTATLADVIVTRSGIPIGGPSGDPLALLLGFTVAPLVEEFGFRVLMIGLVALAFSVWRPWKKALGALWRPSVALEGLAVGSATSIVIWVSVGISSAAFGACHLVCGGGQWDFGKIPEAAYGGVVLGVLYVKYGFHVAVLTHWGVNYLGSVYSFFGQAAYNIPWTTGITSEYVLQRIVDYDLLLLFGVACFIVVTYVGVMRLAYRRTGEVVNQFGSP